MDLADASLSQDPLAVHSCSDTLVECGRCVRKWASAGAHWSVTAGVEEGIA